SQEHQQFAERQGRAEHLPSAKPSDRGRAGAEDQRDNKPVENFNSVLRHFGLLSTLGLGVEPLLLIFFSGVALNKGQGGDAMVDKRVDFALGLLGGKAPISHYPAKRL